MQHFPDWLSESETFISNIRNLVARSTIPISILHLQAETHYKIRRRLLR